MATLDELLYYCKEENSFGALMLAGRWGCGKTYLIEHGITTHYSNNSKLMHMRDLHSIGKLSDWDLPAYSSLSGYEAQAALPFPSETDQARTADL